MIILPNYTEDVNYLAFKQSIYDLIQQGVTSDMAVFNSEIEKRCYRVYYQQTEKVFYIGITYNAGIALKNIEQGSIENKGNG